MNTPFDNPHGLLERMLYPTFKEVYTNGYNQAIEDLGSNKDNAWPPPPDQSEEDFYRPQEER